MSAIVSEVPSEWNIGKQWLVADNKISLIFSSPTSDADSIAGTIITYCGRKDVPTVTGDEAVELLFHGNEGQIFTYSTGIKSSEMLNRSQLDIPFAIELRPIEIADSLMRGNTYYITTPIWYDVNGNTKQGLRHVAVKIKAVTPGNDIHPLKVAFSHDSDSTIHYVMMTYGNNRAATRNFDKLFSFTDPRLQYEQIKDDTWQLITHSQVAEGMTRDECRLALGAPSSIYRGATQAAHIERWAYDDGIYLIFEDGILTRFRK